MITTSYYPCPKCQGTLKLTEHYFPADPQSFLSLEYVVLECSTCRGEARGAREIEAYLRLKKQLIG